MANGELISIPNAMVKETNVNVLLKFLPFIHDGGQSYTIQTTFELTVIVK